MLKQARPGEIAGTGVQGLGTKVAIKVNLKENELKEIEAFYAVNKSKFKDQGVEFKDELLKNTSVASISDKFLYDKFSGYEDIKTPGFKKGVYGKKSNQSDYDKLGQKLEDYGIYNCRITSRNNHYILYIVIDTNQMKLTY